MALRFLLSRANRSPKGIIASLCSLAKQHNLCSSSPLPSSLSSHKSYVHTFPSPREVYLGAQLHPEFYISDMSVSDGGPVIIDEAETNPRVLARAKFAVDTINANAGLNLNFSRVLGAMEAVVHGTMYYITIEVTDGGGEIRYYRVRVYGKPLPEKCFVLQDWQEWKLTRETIESLNGYEGF